MFKGTGSATCSLLAGSLVFNEQYGDVSNVLPKKTTKKTQLLLTVVFSLDHFPTFPAQHSLLVCRVHSSYHVYFKYKYTEKTNIKSELITKQYTDSLLETF